jgi:hypothetical protein
MGFLVFLVIVAAIIVLVVVVKKNKRKKTIAKAIEELKNGEKYKLALRIKDALEKKGGDFGVWEPYIATHWKYDHQAYGIFYMFVPPNKEKYCLRIHFSEYKFPLEDQRDWCFREQPKGCFLVNYCGVLIETEEYSQEMLDYLKIAGDELILSGAGMGELYVQSKLIETP